MWVVTRSYPLSEPLHEAQPVAKGIAQRYQASPVIFVDITFLPSAGSDCPLQCSIQIIDDHIQMQRHPVAAVITLHARLGAGSSGRSLVQQIERYSRAEHLDNRTVEQHTPDTEPERLLVELNRRRQIGNVEIEQQLHDQSGLSNSSRDTG